MLKSFNVHSKLFKLLITKLPPHLSFVFFFLFSPVPLNIEKVLNNNRQNHNNNS